MNFKAWLEAFQALQTGARSGQAITGQRPQSNDAARAGRVVYIIRNTNGTLTITARGGKVYHTTSNLFGRLSGDDDPQVISVEGPWIDPKAVQKITDLNNKVLFNYDFGDPF